MDKRSFPPAPLPFDEPKSTPLSLPPTSCHVNHVYESVALQDHQVLTQRYLRADGGDLGRELQGGGGGGCYVQGVRTPL